MPTVPLQAWRAVCDVDIHRSEAWSYMESFRRSWRRGILLRVHSGHRGTAIVLRRSVCPRFHRVVGVPSGGPHYGNSERFVTSPPFCSIAHRAAESFRLYWGGILVDQYSPAAANGRFGIDFGCDCKSCGTLNSISSIECTPEFWNWRRVVLPRNRGGR